jgi:hypothetical protein
VNPFRHFERSEESPEEVIGGEAATADMVWLSDRQERVSGSLHTGRP